MSPSKQRRDDDRRTVNVRGRRRPYLERRRIGRGDYYLLERIGSPFRERYLAFDPSHGVGGDFFLVQTWPDGPLAQQRLQVLKRLKHDSLPRVVYRQRRGESVDVALTWIEGITLAKYFENIRQRRRPPPTPHEALRLIRGLAHAVCQLNHELQVAHGDIQPPNVIITAQPVFLLRASPRRHTSRRGIQRLPPPLGHSNGSHIEEKDLWT